MDPFDANLENEITASLALAEAPGRKLLIVAVYCGAPDAEGVAQGGLCRAVSADVTRRDAAAFIAGLEREIARIRTLLDGGK